MFFCCSQCKKPITNSNLRPYKKRYKRISYTQKNKDKYDTRKIVIKKKKNIIPTFSVPFDENFNTVFMYNNIFMVTKNKNIKFYCLSSSNILPNIIPPLESGHGCCNWSFGELLSCSCGNVIGKMYLDCYEDSSVELFFKHVEPVYKLKVTCK